MSVIRLSVSLLLSVLLLSACGFQLRGQANLPPELSRIYIQSSRASRGPASPLSRVLGTSLVANGVTLVASPGEADAVLQILDEDTDRRALASNPDGSTREYSLNYSVSYGVVGSDKQTLLAPDRLILTRDVLYDEADVLGRREGEDIVMKSMVDDAAYTIIRRLQTLNARG